jgi:peptide deformylase
MKDPIVQIGAPVLRRVAKPVAKKDFGSKKLASLLAKMKRSLAKEKYGVAIAAPQLGEPLRLFVVAGSAFAVEGDEKVRKEEESLPDRVFINPEILRVSKKTREMSEGCLSVRGTYGSVLRHEKVSIKAHDEHGKAFSYQASGLIAHIFQHEVDHLNGILYIDKAVRVTEDEKVAKFEDDDE